MKRSTPIHLSNNLPIKVLAKISETRIGDMINTSNGEGKVLSIHKDYITVFIPRIGIVNI